MRIDLLPGILMNDVNNLAIDGVWRNNPALVQLLGLCPPPRGQPNAGDEPHAGTHYTRGVSWVQHADQSLKAHHGGRHSAATANSGDCHHGVGGRPLDANLFFRTLSADRPVYCADRHQLHDSWAGRTFCAQEPHLGFDE